MDSQRGTRPLLSVQTMSPPLGADAMTMLRVSGAIADELQAILQLLEADKACGKPSGYAKQARTRLKRVLAVLPT